MKLHGTEEFLHSQAYTMQMRVPVQEVDVPVRGDDQSWLEKCLQKINRGVNPLRFSTEVYQKSKYYYSTEYDPMRKEIFLEKEPFFTSAQRIQMVWDAVQRITVPKLKKKRSLLSLKLRSRKSDKNSVKEKNEITNASEIGKEGTQNLSLHTLIEQNVYCTVYPLHDSETKEDPDPFRNVDQRNWPARKWLFDVWGRFSQWKKYQPLDEIAAYFGVRTGLYFAWLG